MFVFAFCNGGHRWAEANAGRRHRRHDSNDPMGPGAPSGGPGAHKKSPHKNPWERWFGSASNGLRTKRIRQRNQVEHLFSGCWQPQEQLTMLVACTSGEDVSAKKTYEFGTFLGVPYLPFPFFPGILLSRQPPEAQVENGSGFWKERWLKIMDLESTPRTLKGYPERVPSVAKTSLMFFPTRQEGVVRFYVGIRVGGWGLRDTPRCLKHQRSSPTAGVLPLSWDYVQPSKRADKRTPRVCFFNT